MAVALSTLVDIPFVMKRALADGSIGLNGKKVFFIWLRGANDSLNSVIPILDPAYASSRPSLQIPQDAINYATAGPADFPISSNDPASPDFGTYHYLKGIRLGNGFAALHPSLKFLAPVYNAGELALVHRVAYANQSRSHFDSQNYWENGNPNNDLSKDGIFYRTILESGLANSAPLTGVSIQSALPLILRGSDAAMTNLTDPTRYNLLAVPTPAADAKSDGALFNANGFPFAPKKSRELLGLQYENLQKTLGLFSSIDFTEGGNTFRDDTITDNDSDWATSNGSQGYYLFPTTNTKNGGWRRPDGSNAANKYVVDPGHQSFFNNLKSAALVLNNTDAIIAGTELGGFDTHKGQGGTTGNNQNTHPQLNKTIGWAMYALKKYFTRYANKAAWNNVVVVTLSEFGRTTIENSDLGTDHAEAGVMFLGGGGIKGYNPAAGRVTGVFNCGTSDPIPWIPGTSGSMFGVSGRYLKRTTDYRSVLGEIIRKHLGASQNQLNRIIPGYAPGSNENLLAGGSAVDGTQIRGEVGIL
jgi:uncharacterized protein (DUF1501 family)